MADIVNGKNTKKHITCVKNSFKHKVKVLNLLNKKVVLKNK